MPLDEKRSKNEELEDKMKARWGAKPAASQPAVKVKAEHTVKAGETLSDLALKYYGSAVKDKWMKIYEANKAVIGDNPSLIKPGQVLKIPEV